MSVSASSSSVATLARRPSRCATASESRSRAAASESALKIGRISAASRPCWSLRAWPRQSRRKWTVQRCQLQPPQDLGDRGLQPGMSVGDRQLHTDEAALDQAAQKVGPERLGLRLADVDREDLAAARLVDAVR